MINKKLSAGISLLISLIVFLTFAASHFSASEAADPKKKLSDIEKKIEQKKRQVKETLKKEKSVIENIEDINASIRKKERELRNYDKQISRTLSESQRLSSEIDDINAKLSGTQRHLKERLKALYKQQYGGHALILISAEDYQDLIKKSRYISLIAYYDGKVINQYTADIKELIPKKTELETVNAKLNEERKIAKEMQKALRADRVRKDKLLESIRNKRLSYEKTIKELEESSKKLRLMIERLKQKELPASVTGEGFASQKGRLPWPVAGKVSIPFGNYKDPVFNIPVFKNGIEIQPLQGEEPKAIAGGRVVYADWFKGYGLLLIIDHGSGYHSLYGNLSEIFLNTGDILIEGTVVGKIGNSELLSYPTLYFEIRHKGKPVDPAGWLGKNGRASRKIRIK
ncbi:MAG: peptidoglycan DD-metalloendopeptidase family protein, partial [Nitrospirota bacterium]